MMKPDNPLYPYVRHFKLSGDLASDIKRFLIDHDREETYHHLENVAAKAEVLSLQFHGNIEKTKNAAWLHDISAIIPDDKRLEISRKLCIDILPEEEALPMILHQKLSALIARDIFNIEDLEILNAIECHTTLKPNPSLTDKIVFLADKIAWDQPDSPPYRNEVLNALKESLDNALMVYLSYLHEEVQQKGRVLHPWVKSAIACFAGKDQ